MDLLRQLLFLPRGASSMAGDVDLLHGFVITVTMIGSAGVFLTAIWFMWRYHRSGGVEVTPRVVSPFWFEAVVIGGLLFLFLIWFAIGYVQYRGMASAPRNAIDVHVVGKQWMWIFSDASGRRSQSVIVAPRGRPVRLVMTSRDVIHSVFIPEFRLKRDVLPGMYTYLWFQAEQVGTFDLYCTEYCGLSHSRMLGSVVVLEPWDYDRYLEGALPRAVVEAQGTIPSQPEEDLVVMGERAAVQYGCFACHTVTGEPHIAPSWRGLFGSTRELTDGRRVVADDAYLTRSMMQPEIDVVSGFEPVMPSFRGVLSASDTAALVEYIRSLREPAREPPPVELPQVVPVEAPRDAGVGERP